MKFKLSITLLATTLALAATAFADLKKDIVGKWADADKTENIEYKADGTFIETLGGETIKGKYSFPDATHLKVEFEGPMSAMGPVVSPVVIKGDTMDVTGVDGTTVMHYQRQK